MTLDELQSTFPNGFHDSTLHRLRVDFVAKTAVLTLDVDVADHEVTGEVVDRPVQVRLTGLEFVSIEPQWRDRGYSFGELDCDFAEITESPARGWQIPKRTPSVFLTRAYSSTTNSFLYFAATDAFLEPLEAPPPPLELDADSQPGLAALESFTPEGFHDAELCSFDLNFDQCTVELFVRPFVMAKDTEMIFRAARIRVAEVEFFATEVLGWADDWVDHEAVWIYDVRDHERSVLEQFKVAQPPEGHFVSEISGTHPAIKFWITGKRASFRWTEPAPE